MAKAIVKHNRLHFNGKNYFRGNSEEIQLADIGEKRTPVFGMNYLEPKNHVDSRPMKVNASTVVDIDFSRSSETAIQQMASGALKGLGIELSTDMSSVTEKVRSGQLKLAKLSIDLNELENATNADRDALEDLRGFGSDARIVSEIWVVIDASFADEFQNAHDVTVSGSGTIKGIQISTSTSTGIKRGGATGVTLSEGTCLAYMLVKPEWSERPRRRRRRRRQDPPTIIDLDDDQWSVN